MMHFTQETMEWSVGFQALGLLLHQELAQRKELPVISQIGPFSDLVIRYLMCLVIEAFLIRASIK